MRKTATTTITTEGRDKGKVFHLEEMSALKAERWALKAFLALGRSGYEVPEDIATAGVAGLASIGINALKNLRFEEVEPLFEEIMSCVKFIPDPKRPDNLRPLFDGDIEEVTTSLKLKRDVFDLHVNFSLPAAISRPGSMSAGTGWVSA